LDCQQIDEHIWAYCDGTLSPELTGLLDEHLQNCNYCRKMVDLCRMEKEILTLAPDIPPLRDDFSHGVMSSLNRPTTPSARGFRFFSLLGRHRYWLGGSAAAAVLLLALYLPGMIGPSQPVGEMTDIQQKSQSADIANNQPLNGLKNSKTDLPMDAEAPSPELTPDMDYTLAEVEPVHEAANEENTIAMRSPSYDNKGPEAQVLKAMENSRNNDSYKASVDSFSSASNTQVEEMADESDLDKDQSELDLLSLYPGNIPGEYQIEKIVNTSYNTVSYVYRNPDNNEALEITIAIADDLEMKMQSMDVPGFGGSAGTEANVSDALVLNATNTSIFYKNHTVNINLKAAMPLEQLEELAKSIIFEEGLSYEVDE
jgi:hypothetical protein